MTVKNFNDDFDRKAQLEEIREHRNKADKLEKKYALQIFKDLKKIKRAESKIRKLKKKHDINY